MARTNLREREALRQRNIRFSSVVSENFALEKMLTKQLVQDALEFWTSNGLVVKVPPSYAGFDETVDPLAVNFVVEGGTIWTTSFESYKKSVNVTLTGSGGQTEVFVNIVLPGGIMSLKDRERAAALIQSFCDKLRASDFK